MGTPSLAQKKLFRFITLIGIYTLFLFKSPDYLQFVHQYTLFENQLLSSGSLRISSQPKSVQSCQMRHRIAKIMANAIIISVQIIDLL